MGCGPRPRQSGEPPYTRGIHATMHRGRLWTMRQFAGLAPPKTPTSASAISYRKARPVYSTAFDLPTLMGYDSDHALSEGEVGKCGVAISSLADMEVLFDQIPLSDVTTSMTINSPAAVIWAMYLAVAEKQGADWKKISGTLQNDILKEYIAQKEYIYPPEPSMRLVIDNVRIRDEAHAEVQRHLHQRLSHSRSRIDGNSGARLHVARWHGVRRMGHAPRLASG